MALIYELLEEDHTRVRGFIEEIRDGADLSNEDTWRLFSVVRQELEVHMTFEEEDFYPIARDATGLHDEIDTGLEEHEEIRSLLDELSQLDPATDDWIEALEDLVTVLEDHFEDEERELVPAVRETLEPSVAEDLGGNYVQMRRKTFAST